jgi:DNA-binding MarR family transcriptional regulator
VTAGRPDAVAYGVRSAGPGLEHRLTRHQRDPIRRAHHEWVQHGWGAAADGMAMVTSVVRVHRIFTERIDAVLRPHGLTFARYEVLMVLSFRADGAMSMTRLGSLLQVHPSSVTSAVDRLQKQGFAERTSSESDGRVVLATITDAGRRVVASATDGLNSEVFERPGIGAPEVVAVTDLLSAVRADAGDPVEE